MYLSIYIYIHTHTHIYIYDYVSNKFKKIKNKWMNEVRWRAEDLLYLYLGVWVAEKKEICFPKGTLSLHRVSISIHRSLLFLSLLLLFSHPVMSDSVTTWTAAQQASQSLTTSQSLSKFMSIALVMPSSHLIFWHPLLLLPSIFPRIRDFSNESAVRIRWPKYWSFSFSISPFS